MPHVAVSALAFAWSAPAWTPGKQYITTQPGGGPAPGAFFRMDRSIPGIHELEVGPFGVEPSMVELGGPGKAVAEFFDAKYDKLSEVMVKFMYDTTQLAGDDTGPSEFFSHVLAQQSHANRIITLRYVYSNSATGEPGTYDEGKYTIGKRGKLLERGRMISGSLTLVSGGAKAEAVTPAA